MLHDRSRSLDKQSPEIRISAFADAQQFLPAPSRVLLGHHPDPCGQVAPFSECSAIADRCDQRGGGYWPDSRYRRESLARFVVRGCALDQFIHLADSCAELLEFSVQLSQQYAERLRQLRLG